MYYSRLDGASTQGFLTEKKLEMSEGLQAMCLYTQDGPQVPGNGTWVNTMVDVHAPADCKLFCASISGGARNALSIYWWWQIEDFLLSLGPYGMAAAVVLGICIAIGIIITVLRKGGGVDDIRDELQKEVNKKLPWGDAPAGTPGVYDKVGENGYLPCIPDNSCYEVDGDVLDFYRTIFNFYQRVDITADYLSV